MRTGQRGWTWGAPRRGWTWGAPRRGWTWGAPRRGAGAGFTLIELMIVLAIVGTLAMAAQPLMELTHKRLQESALREALRTLRGAIDEHKRLVEAGQLARGEDGSPYPVSLQSLVDGLPLLDEGGRPRTGQRVHLLRKLPRDPMAEPSVPAEASWALRSSASPALAPTPGADVFDVSSRSDGRALDGSLYRSW